MTSEMVKDDKFRLLTTFPDDMPFSVRSTGHYLRTKDWPVLNKHRDVIQFFWVLSGEGHFLIDENYELAKTNMVMIYYPGDRHNIKSVSERFEYLWLSIDGKEALNIIQAFKFPQKPFYAGACPEWLFRKLRNEINDISPFGLNLAALTAYNILSLAKSRIYQSNGKKMIVDRCIEIINSKYNTPDLNVNYIADSLGKNRSLLSHAFKSEMNVSIIDYLMAVRHFKAVDLLVSTSYPISKIATLCGFSSTNYFIRIFKKFEKMTPAVYRKS